MFDRIIYFTICKSCIFCIIILVFINPQTLFSQEYTNNGVLLISEVGDLTLQNSKEISISKTNYEIVKGDILSSESEFNLFIEGDINKIYSITPSTIYYRNDDFSNSTYDYNEKDIFEYSINAYKKLKFGTIINPGVNFTNFGKDTLYHYLQDQGFGNYITNRSNVFINIKQPLLNGLGKKHNTTFIRTSKKRYILLEKQHISNVTQSLRNSYISYLKIIGAKKSLQIQENINKQYLNVIEQVEKLVELDVIPASDLNYLRANYAIQKAELGNIKNKYKNLLAELNFNMGISKEQKNINYQYPNSFYIDDIDLKTIKKDNYINLCYDKSLQNRTDYQSIGLLLEVKQDLVNYYKNELKQNIFLNFSVGYNGIYESNGLDQFYRPYIENIPGVNYQLGISFELNPNNDYKKSNLVKSLGEFNQQEAIKELKEEELYTDIVKNYNEIENYKKNVNFYRDIVNFYKTALEDEQTKLSLGTSTVINLVNVQNNYYQALDYLNDAILNLHIALINFRYTTGALCEIVDNDNSIQVNHLKLFSLPYKNE